MHPAAIAATTYTFPLADVEPVTRWASEAAERLPANVEASFTLATAAPALAPNSPRPKVISVTGTAFGTSPDDARRALEPLRDCPLADHALDSAVDKPTTFPGLYEASDAFWPAAHRNAVETPWSDTPFTTLLPKLPASISDAPSDKTLILAPFWPASTTSPKPTSPPTRRGPSGRTLRPCGGAFRPSRPRTTRRASSTPT